MFFYGLWPEIKLYYYYYYIIEIEVGLHQGSALSPLLFVIIIDVITEEIDEGMPVGNAVRGRPGVVRS